MQHITHHRSNPELSCPLRTRRIIPARPQTHLLSQSSNVKARAQPRVSDPQTPIALRTTEHHTTHCPTSQRTLLPCPNAHSAFVSAHNIAVLIHTIRHSAHMHASTQSTHYKLMRNTTLDISASSIKGEHSAARSSTEQCSKAKQNNSTAQHSMVLCAHALQWRPYRHTSRALREAIALVVLLSCGALCRACLCAHHTPEHNHATERAASNRRALRCIASSLLRIIYRMRDSMKEAAKRERSVTALVNQARDS